MKRTPREKKRLSYERDRRNTYGESPHSSRKSIPRRKAFRNRANRHRQELALRRPPAQPDEYQADRIEAHMFHYAPKVWKKVPDKPLGVTVARSLRGGRRRFEGEGRQRRRG